MQQRSFIASNTNNNDRTVLMGTSGNLGNYSYNGLQNN